jgi:hypothetical protein
MAFRNDALMLCSCISRSHVMYYTYSLFVYKHKLMLMNMNYGSSYRRNAFRKSLLVLRVTPSSVPYSRSLDCVYRVAHATQLKPSIPIDRNIDRDMWISEAEVNISHLPVPATVPLKSTETMAIFG